MDIQAILRDVDTNETPFHENFTDSFSMPKRRLDAGG
jgi:hypothetical protein